MLHYPPPVDAIARLRDESRRSGELARQDWGAIMKALTLFAARRAGKSAPNDLARDLASEAIRRVFDPDYTAWDPSKETLLLHLGSIVNTLLWSHRQRASTRRERGGDLDPDEHAEASSTEAKLAARDEGRRVMKALEEAFPTPGLERDLVRLLGEGVSVAREQAEALGVEVARVYVARRKIDAWIARWTEKQDREAAQGGSP